MSEGAHEDPAVQTISSQLNGASVREKRKSLSPPRDVQGEAKRSEPPKGELTGQRNPSPFKKKYVYSVEDYQH